jgi:hypothetical protein
MFIKRNVHELETKNQQECADGCNMSSVWSYRGVVEINKGESYESAWTLAAVVHLLLAYSHVYWSLDDYALCTN